MNYATCDELIARFGQRELIELTDPDNAAIDAARVQRALDDAQALIDGCVGIVYRLPLRGCAKPRTAPGAPPAYAPPPQLTRIACDLARYYLHHDLAPEHEVYRRYQDAANQLKAIAEGRAQLACPWGGSPGEPMTSDAQSGQNVAFQFSPRAVTDAETGNYK